MGSLSINETSQLLTYNELDKFLIIKHGPHRFSVLIRNLQELIVKKNVIHSKKFGPVILKETPKEPKYD